MQIPDTEWSWLINPRRGAFNELIRGNFIKDKVKYVTSYEKGKYDVAILHVDQQIDSGIWTRGKNSLFRVLNEIITDIPKIVINHGTPFYPECPEFLTSSALVKTMKNIIGDNTMVVNSHRAKEMWAGNISEDEQCEGIPKDQIIAMWHGMNIEDFKDLPKEPRVITMISAGGLPAYYGRTYLQRVREELDDRGIKHCHITVDWRNSMLDWKGQYGWDNYRDFIGRSLIYFNPTSESPMPRSRTEAMLSGCCVVSTPYHDADTFIKSGENGILVGRNPEKTADIIQGLLEDYQIALELGQAGKKTAQELFGIERFTSKWRKLLENVIK